MDFFNVLRALILASALMNIGFNAYWLIKFKDARGLVVPSIFLYVGLSILMAGSLARHFGISQTDVLFLNRLSLAIYLFLSVTNAYIEYTRIRRRSKWNSI